MRLPSFSSRSDPQAVAQLMRIHVVTPKCPVRVELNARVRPGPGPSSPRASSSHPVPVPPLSTPTPIFHVGGCDYETNHQLFSSDGPPGRGTEARPVSLAPSKYWILRLPFAYVCHGDASGSNEKDKEGGQQYRCFYPPPDGSTPSVNAGVLLRDWISVSDMSSEWTF